MGGGCVWGKVEMAVVDVAEVMAEEANRRGCAGVKKGVCPSCKVARIFFVTTRGLDTIVPSR